MAKQDKSTESVYRVTEVIGTSAQSWEDAAKAAVKTAQARCVICALPKLSKWM